MKTKRLNYCKQILKQLKKYQLHLTLGLITTLLTIHLTLTPTLATLTPTNTPIPTPQLIQQANDYYQTGQYSAAISLWQQAATTFAAQNDTLNQAMVLSNLALAYRQLGQWTEANQAITTSLNLLQTQNNPSTNHLKTLAQALNTQANLQLAQGNAQQALTTWQQATQTYQQVGDETGITRSLINQAQALRTLGFFRRARNTLNQVQQRLQTQPDSITKAASLRSLGDLLRLIGNTNDSRPILQESLAIAQRLQSPTDITATLFSLANTARSQKQTRQALDYYQQAATTATSPITQFQAQANQFSLLIETQQLRQARTLAPKLQSQITQLPLSRTSIYAQLHFAQNLNRLRQISSQDTPSLSEIAQLLATAIQQAKTLNDQQAESYALGYLGQLYEQTEQWYNAQTITEQALTLAQTSNAPEIAYRWYWQLARLYQTQGKTEQAIASYTQAVDTLQSLRQDIASINPDLQFSFRDSIEPVYRQFVALLLQPSLTKSETRTNSNLNQARQLIESLQIAELNNFFQQACLETTTLQVDQVDQTAAVVYPIILDNRIEVILSLPGSRALHYSATLQPGELEEISDRLQQALYQDPIRRGIFSTQTLLPLSQKLYNWLLRPAEADLAKSGVKTLVFVPDGILRNLPMAVLHDGQQYLIEKYSIALNPGLQLLHPKSLQGKRLKALTAGLTEGRLNFPPLENVTVELNEIQATLPSEILLDQDFTTTTLQERLATADFPIIHLATHGQFSSKAENTFILAWDRAINVIELDEILQSRTTTTQIGIDLFVLSACQTATGDNRATLGLAGVAVKAGANSTLATLWSVSDRATASFMSQFYRELTQTNLTRSEALRHTQRTFLEKPEFQHPFFWAPYTLVGNWL